MDREKLGVMMEEYDELKKKLEAKEYSGIVQYKQVALGGRIVCRLLQLALAAFFMFLLSFSVISHENSIIEKIMLMLILLVAWPILHGVIDWYIWAFVSKPSSQVEFLPVSGYFAKRKMRAEMAKLRLELNQLDEKEARLEPILEKFSKLAVVVGGQLDGETYLVKEAGKHPWFKALIKRDSVLDKVGRSNDGHDDPYIRLSYDLYGESAYEDFLYDLKMLLVWKRCTEERKWMKDMGGSHL